MRNCIAVSIIFIASSLASGQTNQSPLAQPSASAVVDAKYGYINCGYSGWRYVPLFDLGPWEGAQVARPKCGEKVLILESTDQLGKPWNKVKTASGTIGYTGEEFVSSVPKLLKGRINIHVLRSDSTQPESTYTIPGSPERTTTHCNSGASATAIDLGGMTTAHGSGTTDCTTTTTPATPPTSVVSQGILQVYVRALLEDGTRVTLWCQKAFRDCGPLESGLYPADLNRDIVWMWVSEMSGREHRVKYRLKGGW